MATNEPESPESPISPESSDSPASFAENLNSSLSDSSPSSSPAEGEGAPSPAPSPGAELDAQNPPWWKEKAQALGFENVADQDDFVSRWEEDYRIQQEQARQAYEQAQQWRYQAEQLYYAQQQRQQSQQAPAPPAEQPASWWSPPNVDEAIVRKYLTVNQETGQPEWRADTPLDLRRNYEQLHAYREDWARQLLYNPTEAAKRLWEGEFQKRIDETLAQREQAQRQEWERQQAIQTAHQIQQQHAQWIYQPDPRDPSRPLVNPYTGQPQPTQQGALILENLQLIDQARHGDPSARFHAATLMALGRMYASGQQFDPAHPLAPVQPPAPPPTPQQVAQEKRQEHRKQTNGAGRLANQGGSLTHAQHTGQPQNRHLRFDELLAADLSAAGF